MQRMQRIYNSDKSPFIKSYVAFNGIDFLAPMEDWEMRETVANIRS